MYDDLLRLETGSSRRLPNGAHRRLRAEPDFKLVGLKMHGGVERLHRGMSQMRRFIHGLDKLSAFAESIVDAAVIARAHHRSIKSIAIELGELRAVGLAGRADVPFGLKQSQRLFSAPEAVGDNSDGVFELDHLQYATTAFRRSIVDALQLAAEYGARRNSRIDHVRHFSIDGKFRRAIDLERGIKSRKPLADQLELIRRADRWLLVELDLCGIGCERAIIEASARRLVSDLAVGCFAVRR